MRPQRISPVWWVLALRRWLRGHAPEGEPRLIHRDPDSAIVWLPGRSDRLVVVFLGIQGKRLRPNRLEFSDIAWDQGRNNVLFVTDRHRSWYSRPDQRERIAKVIRRFAAAKGFNTLWSMGGSMGGYGAILFAGLLPISQVVAFVPQVLMTEEVICRPVWAINRPNITDAVVRDLVPVIAGTKARINILYGDRDEDDLIHFGHLRRTLPASELVRIVIAPGQTHKVAPWLKAQGQLGRVVAALWAGDRRELEDCSKALERPLDLALA